MSLNNFFSINFPYGLEKGKNNNWFAFNRSYVPLGWHDKKDDGFNAEVRDNVSASYGGLTDKLLKELAVSESGVGYDAQGKINKIMLYDDSCIPNTSKKNWETYISKLYKLSKLTIDRQKTKSNQQDL